MSERNSPQNLDLAKIQEILDRVHILPVLDPRPVEEIIAELYDENGLFR
jgi:hypothetical protein